MAGYDVSREFYINDAGNQIDKFALSLDIRYQQLFSGDKAPPLPEDSYHGADIKERAEEFAKQYGDSYMEKSEEQRRKALVDFALPKNIQNMRTISPNTELNTTHGSTRACFIKVLSTM